MGQERLQAGYINTVERPLSGPPSTGCSINRIHRGVKVGISLSLLSPVYRDKSAQRL
ncbi:hypothetical protein M514_03146 [Trichuris suis]|uniref:Uncharacterized protein n=1 Tax=Trichuris suis TaxID=68888 RepID=A0A085N924_9BILA|nr:hypothetical protein M514_03146 [Trichuris suis]